jgi:hypothetical protein
MTDPTHYAEEDLRKKLMCSCHGNGARFCWTHSNICRENERLQAKGTGRNTVHLSKLLSDLQATAEIQGHDEENKLSSTNLSIKLGRDDKYLLRESLEQVAYGEGGECAAAVTRNDHNGLREIHCGLARQRPTRFSLQQRKRMKAQTNSELSCQAEIFTR